MLSFHLNLLFLESTAKMSRDDDAGPLVNDWDEK